MNAESKTTQPPTASISQPTHINISKQSQLPKPTFATQKDYNQNQGTSTAATFIFHPIQKDNPAMKKLGFKADYKDYLHVDILVKEIDLGLLYLDSSHHLTHETQLEQRLEYMKSGSSDQKGKSQAVVYIMDHNDAHRAVCTLQLLCEEFGVQLLLVKDQTDFKNLMNGLNKRAYALLKKNHF